MGLVSCGNECMGEMDHLKHQAQGMSPQKRARGGQKLYGRTAALAHLVSLGKKVRDVVRLLRGMTK